jgi:hypothetical protein
MTGVDSCEKVREWKSSQGGSGGGGYVYRPPPIHESPDAIYAGGITSGGEMHPWNSPTGIDKYPSTP